MTAAWITAGGTVLAFLIAAVASVIGFAVNRRMQLWEQESKIYAQVLHRTGVQKAIRKKQLEELDSAAGPDFLGQVAKSYEPEAPWRGIEAQFTAYADQSVIEAYDASVAANQNLVKKSLDGNIGAVRDVLNEIIARDDELIDRIRNECAKLRKVNVFGHSS